jgi:hypothetical protein
MHVIRHCHKFIQHYERKMFRNGVPTIPCGLPQWAETNLAVNHLTKRMRSVLRADGDEIGRVAAIIPSRKPCAGNAIFFLVFIGVYMSS